jgi:pyruvate/2-oxoglutarate dehydrogenase complex dihydrolipoamide dehydrogenase (E3) component
VLGGGPIGIEMAQAHRRLGSAVTVIEADRALGRDDPETAAVVLAALRAEGVAIREQTAAARIAGGAGVTVHLPDGSAVAGTHLLVAAGRRVETEALGLAEAGIKAGPKGIAVDARLRTTNRRVHAIGDAAGGLQFTHVAGYQAGVVIRSALFGLPARQRTDHIPWVTYTDPELAQIGLTESAARDRHGARLEVVRVPFAQNDRARAEGRTAGLLKVMVVRGRPGRRVDGRARRGRAGAALGAGDRGASEDERDRGHGRALSDAGRDQQGGPLRPTLRRGCSDQAG